MIAIYLASPELGTRCRVLTIISPSLRAVLLVVAFGDLQSEIFFLHCTMPPPIGSKRAPCGRTDNDQSLTARQFSLTPRPTRWSVKRIIELATYTLFVLYSKGHINKGLTGRKPKMGVKSWVMQDSDYVCIRQSFLSLRLASRIYTSDKIV